MSLDLLPNQLHMHLISLYINSKQYLLFMTSLYYNDYLYVYPKNLSECDHVFKLHPLIDQLDEKFKQL